VRLAEAPPNTCVECAYQMFVNARPTASVIVVDGDKFLVLKRAIEPKAGLWEVPGGFCHGLEHPAEAAIREAREELGVQVNLGDFVGMYVGSYDFQGETLPVLDSFFLATVPAGEEIVINHESSDLDWFSLYDPPPLAFATMDAAMRDVSRRRGQPGRGLRPGGR
jgi:8-oxo-dGTP diphosphatase